MYLRDYNLYIKFFNVIKNNNMLKTDSLKWPEIIYYIIKIRIIINNHEKVVVDIYLLYFCVTFINYIQISYGTIYVVEVVNSKKSGYGTFWNFFDSVSIASFFY